MSALGFQRISSVLGVATVVVLAGACSVKGGTVLEPNRTKGEAASSDAGPSSLQPLAPIDNVTAIEREDSVGIDFDPVDDAVDYRVYELPNSAVSTNADGSLVIRDATYRCAGLRQTYHVPTNQNSNDTGNGVVPTKPGVVFAGAFPYVTATVPDQPLLGYVFTSAAPDRAPVYAVGIAPSAGEGGWRESRAKIYTTDPSERAALLSDGGRDDGIVFYVPKSSSADTVTLYRSATFPSLSRYYFLDADRATHENDTTPPSAAFPILRRTESGAEPLYAVFYEPAHPHTELAVGRGRFARAANQGPGPLWHLEWSGITRPTTLVVEALAHGCPYQGLLSPEPLDAPPHQRFYTLDELRAASPTGEVYINGQYDVVPGSVGDALLETPTASPVPIARAFLNVAPRPHDPNAWDWYQGFPAGVAMPPYSEVPDPKFANDPASTHGASALFDFGGYSLDNPDGVLVFTHGPTLGQFWHAFDDWKQDVTGRVRWTAQQRGSVDADPSKHLHVTWSVNTVSTGRRYPQLIVTDQPPPIEGGFQNANGNFLIVQTIGGPSMRLEAQAFHGLVGGGPWAPNNQALAHGLVDDAGAQDSSPDVTSAPADPPFEHAGMDRMTRYDAYISTERLYVFVDGAPAACTKYPRGGFSLNGAVTITFGDVLDHEGAETEVGSCTKGALTGLPFLNRHQCTETSRHWDDLGFKSGVAGPDWDEARFPCVAY